MDNNGDIPGARFSGNYELDSGRCKKWNASDLIRMGPQLQFSWVGVGLDMECCQVPLTCSIAD